MANSEIGRRTLDEVGELELIQQVTRGLTMPASVSIGPGDDAAVFLVNGSAVCTTDILIEGVHFKRDWSSAVDVGRKAVAVNVADIEAMGVSPVVMLVAFSAPGDLPEQWVREFMTGLRDEAEAVGVALVGGDVTRSTHITVAVTMIGQTSGIVPVARSGAHVGNVVAVRGRLGWAAAGLTALSRGFRSPRAAVDAQRVPEVPYGEGRIAAASGASAMIDVSDGLLNDLNHIAVASDVWIDLNSTAFVIANPVAAVAAAIGCNPLDFVLAGGEDHALAATFPPDQVPANWDIVGSVCAVDDQGPRVSVDGVEYMPEIANWTHFSHR